MSSNLSHIDKQRTQIASSTARDHKAAHGQFMTPATVATFMASLMTASGRELDILDPGAGIGSLASSFLHKIDDRSSSPDDFPLVKLTAVEADHQLLPHLHDNIGLFQFAESRIVEDDFVEFAVNEIQFGNRRYSHVIMNPPYKKIGSSSSYRSLGRAVGIETVNLYSLFVALSILLLRPGGELVAIIPRSFCNGPYYRNLRDIIVDECSIERVHLFESRKSLFSHDNVLQENIIIHLKRNGQQGDVVVSRSTDDTLTDLEVKSFPFVKIIRPTDKERFLRIPSCAEGEDPARFVTLADLNIKVSTGPVVDFRAKEHLRTDPCAGAVPLLYPAHFRNGSFEWPLSDFKKANAIMLNEKTQSSMFPIGNYVVTRRFSSKEERRRVIASTLLRQQISGFEYIGFENHFNVYHINKQGLSSSLTHGLAAYLNSVFVDEYFRQFSGHTQVNATDLRNMPYPTLDKLKSLGKWLLLATRTEKEIEKKIATFL